MYRTVSLFLLTGLLTFSAMAQDTTAPAENLSGECVTDYDPEVDYFPEKVEVTHAEFVGIEYFNNYKVVTVTNAFDGAEPFTYVLVQCGTPAPDASQFPAGTQFIEVPADNIIMLSTTQLPHLDALGLIDHLIGVDSFFYISSPVVREMIEDESLIEVGFGSEVNVELVLDTEPDMVMASGFDPDTDAHPLLISAGVFTALNAEWREATPLGRAEWVKFTALFFNAEVEAEIVFDGIVTGYNQARELANTVPEDERPIVLWNTLDGFTSSWLIPGEETYAGRLILDAGGRIALGEEAPTGTAFLDFEVVYDGALAADIWILNLFATYTVDDLVAQDTRYADFAAVVSGNVWNNDLDVNENGGNNYFELGVANPQLIVRDLVAIFHPELLPDHEFNFFRPLDSAGE